MPYNANENSISANGAQCFGALLFGFRTQTSTSQRELARRTRMSAGCLSEIENCRRPAPTSARIDAICTALCLPTSDRTLLHSAAANERLIKLRVGRGVPIPVAELLREIARLGPLLSHQHIVAIRSNLKEAATM